MELLLNLFWLTLAVPATWMWCRGSVCARGCRTFDRARPFLLLGCALIILFPVVSATDDLRAMRQEMEESCPSKRVVKQAVGDKSLTDVSRPGILPAWIFPVFYGPSDEACGRVLLVSVVLPQPFQSDQHSPRAPPRSSLREGVVAV